MKKKQCLLVSKKNKNFRWKNLLIYGGIIFSSVNINASNSQVGIKGERINSYRVSTFDGGKADSIINVANSLTESEYTVPSWTLLRMAVTKAVCLKDSISIVALQTAISNLKNYDTPYNVVTTLLSDPKTTIGFAWFTNSGVTCGKVEIVTGIQTDTTAFGTPDFTFYAKSDSVCLNYSNPANNLVNLACIPDNVPKNYLSNKATAIGLTPNTTYSYRVGRPSGWSRIGTFKTSNSNSDPFSFIYVTDPQSSTDAMFDISQKTTHQAQSMYPSVNFWLNCGDLVESSGNDNSEWEYEQFFETQQDIFLNHPSAPVAGNHDNSVNMNFSRHFNTDSPGFDKAISTVTGSNYSFVYGDALFMGLNFENYDKPGYIDSLTNWMHQQVASNPTLKWRIAFFHKTIYTGGGHIGEQDLNDVRNAIAPVFDELKIDLALQGHDHIYELIGPVFNKQLVPNAVSNQSQGATDYYSNVNGKSGGVFNVNKGTLYFLNGRSGSKEYSAWSKDKLDTIESSLGLNNLYSLFTGRLGQTLNPSFSQITVSTDTITVKTYTVNPSNLVVPYDSFKVVKYDSFESADSILRVANTLQEMNYTTPSWTLFRRALTTASSLKDTASLKALQMATDSLKSREMPYNINTSIRKDPKTELGFAWFTNKGITGGRVEIVTGKVTDSIAFTTPDFTFNAICDSVTDLNYCYSGNNLFALAGIPDNTKKSYVSNKATAIGLSPNATYSYRVGKTGAWSNTGTFTTAKDSNDQFSFIYTTDCQENSNPLSDASKKTEHAALQLYPDINFWVDCGDIVESSGSDISEWEYEQFFQTQQDIFLKKPWAPVTGNHDVSPERNFNFHFNTDSIGFDNAMSTVPGSNYSFVYGDALFMGLSFEDFEKNGYLDSLTNWMRSQVDAHPNTKWRIAFFHKPLYTGGGHQIDVDITLVRNLMAPVFDELKIDLALQGHDHVYEVIGPVYNKQLIENAVTGQYPAPYDYYTNVNSRAGGIFNVNKGTLYFLNGRTGSKEYAANKKDVMDSIESELGLTNAYDMFTGRLGQTINPSFSYITVSSDTISVKTFTVDTLSRIKPFDSFKVVKFMDVGTNQPASKNQEAITIYPVPVKDYAYLNMKIARKAKVEVYSMKGDLVISEFVYGSTRINCMNLKKDIYILKVKTESDCYVSKMVKQ